MKKETHPNYSMATIKCACGKVYTVRSTKTEQRLEICGNCHPFYTGKQRFVDTAGRVEKFRKRFGIKEEAPAAEPVAAESAAS